MPGCFYLHITSTNFDHMKNKFNRRDENFSRNAINSRDDVHRNQDNDADWRGTRSGEQNRYSSGRDAWQNNAHTSDYGQTARNQDNYHRGNQFGLHQPGSAEQRPDSYRGYTTGRDQRGEAYGNPDSEWGNAYRGYNENRNSRNREYNPDNQGYNGRNASDYNNDRYSDHYYYSPNEDHSERRRSTYGSEHDHRLSNYYGREHSDYFDHHPERDEKGAYHYYGSYPSYNQSRPDDRDDEDRDRPNIRDRRY